MYILKKVGIEFSDILKNLMKDTFYWAYKDMHSKKNIANYCADNFTNKSVSAIFSSSIYTCIIAFKGNVPVGFFILKDKECPFNINNTSLELQQLYILKSVYNTGLGKELFTNVIHITKTLSKSYIWLTVTDSNNKARSFYEKKGFKKLGIGKEISVGTDTLSSSVMIYKL